MNKTIKKLTFLLLYAVSLSLALHGCGGGGGSETESGDPAQQTTTIVGSVSDVITAKLPADNEFSILTSIKNFIAPVKTAVAEGPESEGILVELIIDGEVVESDITDSEGKFEFNFTGGGAVTLRFTTSEFTTTIEIMVPDDGIVSLVVRLEGEGVVVEESETEFAGNITEVNCPFITLEGGFTVDLSSSEFEDEETGEEFSCEDLEPGDRVAVKGEIDLDTGLVIAGNIKINSDDDGEDDGDDDGDDDGEDDGDDDGEDDGDDGGEDDGDDDGEDDGDDGGEDDGDDDGEDGGGEDDGDDDGEDGGGEDGGSEDPEQPAPTPEPDAD